MKIIRWICLLIGTGLFARGIINLLTYNSGHQLRIFDIALAFIAAIGYFTIVNYVSKKG